MKPLSRTKVLHIMIVFMLAPASPALGGEIQGTCLLRFMGISTLHDFSGTVRCRPFSADLVKSVNGGTEVPVVEVDVPVDEMETGNGTRDGQMRKMFQSGRFPRIHGTVKEIDVDRIRRESEKEGGGKASFDLSLRIRDVERNIRADVTGLREEGSTVSFDVEFPVSLGEFGLKAPSFLGIFRVRDKVTVTGNVMLERSSKE